MSPDYKKGVSSKKGEMHYAILAVIKDDGKYFLIDRAIPPYGFSCVEGHMFEGETENETLEREVKEESGFEIKEKKLAAEGEYKSWCNKGAFMHYWYVFNCYVEGEMKLDEKEAKGGGWYSSDGIKGLNLEDSCRYWFEKLGVI